MSSPGRWNRQAPAPNCCEWEQQQLSCVHLQLRLIEPERMRLCLYLRLWRRPEVWVQPMQEHQQYSIRLRHRGKMVQWERLR